MIASMCGHLNNVSVLLDLGSEIDLTNVQGKTAIDLAVEYGYVHIVQLLQRKKRKLVAPLTNMHSKELCLISDFKKNCILYIILYIFRIVDDVM